MKFQKKAYITVLINIDSVIKIDKKNYPHVYLEECRHNQIYRR